MDLNNHIELGLPWEQELTDYLQIYSVMTASEKRFVNNMHEHIELFHSTVDW